MPQLDQQSHGILMAAGYEYDTTNDKYFNRGNPVWDAEEKAGAGRRQGAFPSSTVEEFRSQEAQWIAAQWEKIKLLKASTQSQ